jgi:hypothetical protein
MKRGWEKQKWLAGESKKGRSLRRVKGWQGAERTERWAWQVGQERLGRQGQWMRRRGPKWNTRGKDPRRGKGKEL